MFCPKCGTSCDAGTAFCSKCGSSFPKVNNTYQNQGYNYQNQNNYNQYQSNYNQNQQGKGKAIAAIVCGAFAFMVPIPILDIIAGAIGIILAVIAGNEGYREGIRTAGLIVSIVGLISAVLYNFYIFIIGMSFLDFLYYI
jgi:hypothetical protein